MRSARCTGPAIWLFNAIFIYFFLLDQVVYLNHFYMIILFGLLLGCVDAHRCWSLDRRLGRIRGARRVPAWHVHVLRFQIEVILIFSGLVKIEIRLAARRAAAAMDAGADVVALLDAVRGALDRARRPRS